MVPSGLGKEEKLSGSGIPINDIPGENRPRRNILPVKNLHKQRYGRCAHKFHTIVNCGDFGRAAGGKLGIIIAAYLEILRYAPAVGQRIFYRSDSQLIISSDTGIKAVPFFFQGIQKSGRFVDGCGAGKNPFFHILQPLLQTGFPEACYFFLAAVA